MIVEAQVRTERIMEALDYFPYRFPGVNATLERKRGWQKDYEYWWDRIYGDVVPRDWYKGADHVLDFMGKKRLQFDENGWLQAAAINFPAEIVSRTVVKDFELIPELFAVALAHPSLSQNGFFDVKNDSTGQPNPTLDDYVNWQRNFGMRDDHIDWAVDKAKQIVENKQIYYLR